MSIRAATAWSLIYVAAALGFGAALGIIAGWSLGAQFLAGYVVEKSLSVDNLFVFVVIMSTFAAPAERQARVLGIGIALALVLRGIFIAVGSVLLATFSFMFLVFGMGLIATAVHLFRHSDAKPSVSSNPVVAFARRRLRLTPLAITLVAIATTDFLFALDSIPAVYGVTQHAYIVLAANVFALLGLRALYFVVSGLLDRLVYLSTGLAVILAFIGVKLVLHFAHLHHASVPEISTVVSLGVIVAVLAVTTVTSLARGRHAGGRTGRRSGGRTYTPDPMALPGFAGDPGVDGKEPDPDAGKPATVGAHRGPGGSDGRDLRGPRWTARSRARPAHRRLHSRTLDVRARRRDGVP
jgi:tellurite resistance protein TerC